MKFKAIFAISAAVTAALLSVLAAPAGAYTSVQLQCGVTAGPTLSSMDALAKKYFPTFSSYLEVQNMLTSHFIDYYATHNSFTPILAKVVVFGEDHTNPGERFATQTLINGLSKLGDVVLVEGAPADQIVPGLGKEDPITNLLNAGLWIVGWDNMDLWGQTVEAFAKRDSAPNGGLWQMFNQQASNLSVSRDSVMEDVISDTLKTRPTARVFVIAGYEHTRDSQLEDFLLSINAAALDPIPEKWEQFKTETEAQYATSVEQTPLGAVIQADNTCGSLQ